MPVRYERVKVTKSFARQLLDANVDYNRNKKTSKILGMIQDMNNGDWDTETGETIKVTKDGKLIDGQNRMNAFLESDLKTLEFDIAYDVPEKAFEVIDTGAARTFGDLLKQKHVTGERFANGAIVRRVYLWEKGYRMGSKGYSKARPTQKALVHRWTEDPGGFDAASRRGRDIASAGMGQAGVAGSAFYLFAQIDKDVANNYFDAVLTGADLPAGHPALWLSRKLSKDRTELTSDEQMILWVKTWNMYRKDQLVTRTVSVLGFRGQEYTQETFPVPE